MPGVGVGLVVIGYGMLFTVYQKTWGQGGSLLYWITGSSRFPAPATAQRDTTGGASTTNPDVVSGANNQGGQGPVIRH